MGRVYCEVLIYYLLDSIQYWISRESLKACLVNCNGNYIEIWIDIIKNTKCCNVMFITINLFGDDIIIEP